MNYKQHTNCRVCGSTKLTPYLDLGMMPLSNQLMNSPTEEPERFPLVVALCEHCGLSQLTIVIPAEKMFSHYVYRSGISQGYKEHCLKMAEQLIVKYGRPFFHIDIAGNDGTLLSIFKEEQENWFDNNFMQLNIDPAENLVKINAEKGIRQYTAFWGMKAATHLKNTDWPKADLITATNVFAHVDDVTEFLAACHEALAPTGKLVLEFPYLLDFIERKEFDTVYFEHLSYFSITPLVQLCNDLGLTVLSVSHHEIHGGSVRVIVGKTGEPDESVNYCLANEYEFGLTDIKVYRQWANEVRTTIRRFKELMYDLGSRGAWIAGFAASAKGNTLLNAAGIKAGPAEPLFYIIDETPEKIGKYSPGTGLQIVGLTDGAISQLEYIVILSWNFHEEIIAKVRVAGYSGRFILPLTCEII